MGIYDNQYRRIVMPRGSLYSEAKPYRPKKKTERKKHPSTKLKSEYGHYRWGKEEGGLIPIELWREKYGSVKMEQAGEPKHRKKNN